MTQAQLSPVSVVATPREVNPQNNLDTRYKVPVVEDTAIQTGKAIQTDTVTISQQAMKMLASDIEWVRVPPWRTRVTKQ